MSPSISTTDRSRTRARALVRLAVAAGCALLLAACSGHGRGAEPTGRPQSRPAAAAISALGAEAAHLYLPADGAQLAAAAPLEGDLTARVSAATAACMTRSGFRTEPVTAAQAASQVTDNTDFPDLTAISQTKTFSTGYLTAAQGPPLGMSAARQRAYQVASAHCAAISTRPLAPLAGVAQELNAAWSAVVSRIQASAPVVATLAGWRTCMEAYGAPAAQVSGSSSAGSFALFLAWETGQETRAAGKSAQAAVERYWALAFATCAQATVAVQQRLQLASQQVFLRQHAGQVRLLKILATQLLNSSARPGPSR
jgi:hypothetical protein